MGQTAFEKDLAGSIVTSMFFQEAQKSLCSCHAEDSYSSASCLPLGLLCAPEVSNAACLLLGAGVKVHIYCFCIEIFRQQEWPLFTASKILKARGRWVAMCTESVLEVQLPVSLTLQSIHQHLLTAKSLKTYTIFFRELGGKVSGWSDSEI